jgi:hypothetical protein
VAAMQELTDLEFMSIDKSVHVLLHLLLVDE